MASPVQTPTRPWVQTCYLDPAQLMNLVWTSSTNSPEIGTNIYHLLCLPMPRPGFPGSDQVFAE